MPLDELLKDQPRQDEEPQQDDLFVIVSSTANWPVKDDMSSMEHPVFALSKTPFKEIRTYSRAGNVLKVIPSAAGAPTIFDKDLLIYVVSELVRAADTGRKVSKRIKIDVTHFLKATSRSTGGASYDRVVDMCRRLRGTTIETNIKTTEEERTKGFGLIESYEVTSATKSGKGALELEVTISDWLYRAAVKFEVLTLHEGYFRLSQALERRAYEVARKHCGKQNAWWAISIDGMQEKTGSAQTARKFKQDIKRMVAADELPEYHIALDESVKPNIVYFLTKDHEFLRKEAARANKLEWLQWILQMKLRPESKQQDGAAGARPWKSQPA